MLDAGGLLAWLFDEPGADAVDDVLASAALSAVNLAQVLARADEAGLASAGSDRLRWDLEAYGVVVVPFTAEDASLVPKLRRAERREKLTLMLADCCCLSAAVKLGLPVVGGDKRWEALGFGLEVRPIT